MILSFASKIYGTGSQRPIRLKRVDQMRRPASRNNEDEIETEIEVLIALMPREPKIGRAMHPAPGERCHCGLAILDCCAVFYFDEHHAPSPLGDEIDLTEVRFEAPREDAVTLGH